MIVVLIGFTIAAISVIALMPLFNRSHLDSAYDTTLIAMRNTRHLAITQSHLYYVSFNPTGFPAGTIEIQYQPPAVAGILPPLQLVTTYAIPNDVSYAVQAGFPPIPPTALALGRWLLTSGTALEAGGANTLALGPTVARMTQRELQQWRPLSDSDRRPDDLQFARHHGMRSNRPNSWLASV